MKKRPTFLNKMINKYGMRVKNGMRMNLSLNKDGNVMDTTWKKQP